MIKTEMCELLGIKHPIIQAGMGPFSNNKLCIATANAGVLGLLSTSGLGTLTMQTQPEISAHFIETAGADPADDRETVLRKLFDQTSRGTKATGGIFGVNVMVSAEQKEDAELIINTAIQAREENPELKERFKVIFTSAGDPLPWGDKGKGAGFKWLHIVPSVKGAKRAQKAGVDMIVASGHEGGFHTSWEPVHSMTLLPAVVEELSGSGIPVVGAGGFCDGRTLAAALSLGAVGVQMGTRFLATKESDFAQMWKEGIVNAGDRDTLIARGFVGPARWIKTTVSKEHQKNTLLLTPEVFLDTPGEWTEGALKLIDNEIKGLNAVSAGDKENALIAAGECAQRIKNLPLAKDLVDQIIEDATDIIRKLPTVIQT